MMRNDEGHRTKKSVKPVTKSEEITEIQARKDKNYNRKFTFCPVCHANGNFTHFKNHMYTHHKDYINRNNIAPSVFEFLEVLANSDYSTKDKFVYYNWPEDRELVKADLNKITNNDYKSISYAFWLINDSQKNASVNDIIRSLMLYGHMSQITAYDFIKRCVEEGILIYDGIFYSLDQYKLNQSK